MSSHSWSPLAIDLFCGCGGISAGLRDAGIKVLAGADVEPNYLCTFRHNFPDAAAITEDLSRIRPNDLMKMVGIGPGDLDLLAGGPPCQGFSRNVPRKNRTLDSANNRLVHTFLDYAIVLQPKMILMETEHTRIR